MKAIKHAIGVVGSRRCTAYGRKIAEEIGVELAQHGIPLVSGFAKGIDSYTQAACINHGGYAALFLAGGVDICYPLEQQSLYFKTLKNGGVFLSQFPPGTKPHPKQFLRRNAFISAWSTELIVVEASEKSGALWTADFAKKQGKQVYAVPHPISTPEGKGCNLLLTEGAKPYLSWQSLTSLFDSYENYLNTITTKVLDPILEILANSPASISHLSHELNMSESVLMDKLLNLELQGKLIVRGNMVSAR